MTPQDKKYRAAEAQRLLNEPLLKEALRDLEAGALSDALQVRGVMPEDDLMRRHYLDLANLVISLRGKLEQIIATGKYS